MGRGCKIFHVYQPVRYVLVSASYLAKQFNRRQSLPYDNLAGVFNKNYLLTFFVFFYLLQVVAR